MYQDGHPLSRVDLVAAVCQALTADGHDVSRFNGHSFWIGAATTAAQVGVPDSVSRSLEVVRIHDLCLYLAIAADSYLLSPSVFLTVLCFCMFVCFTVSCIGCLLVVSCFI